MPKEVHDKFNFRIYVQEVLKEIHPEKGITKDALNELNMILHDVAKRIIVSANMLVRAKNGKTLTSASIQNALLLHFTWGWGETLVKRLVSAGLIIVTSLGKKKESLLDDRTYLTPKFPVSRIDRLIRYHTTSHRVSVSGALYFTGVLERLCTEILDLAVHAASDSGKTRITTRQILLAIKGDDELRHLFKDLTLTGGVVPFIHNILLPKRELEFIP